MQSRGCLYVDATSIVIGRGVAASGLGAVRMYLSHWGMSRSPFAAGAGQIYFEGESQVEALARLRFLSRDRRGGALVTGAAGVGKTLLARRFGGSARRSGQCVATIAATGVSAREMLWQVAAQWALAPRPTDDVPRLHRRLVELACVDLQSAGLAASPLLLVDDADQLGPDPQTQLVRALAAMSSGPARPMVLLTCSSERADRLDLRLCDVVDLRVDLEPWEECETIAYVQHASIESGCDRPIFTDDALATLHVLSGGVPRMVNRLADHGLLLAAAENLEVVTADVVEAAGDAVGWLATSGGRDGRGAV